MNRFTNICVFCGSNVGREPTYAMAARELGRLLVRNDVRLVFGGGQVGLMGVIADAVLEAGGEAVGVIPKALATKELLHVGATHMHVVSTMHERKAKMADLADAFIALPGGFGTMEELFEIVTWAQLGIHQKPIGLLNSAGYFDPLVRLVKTGIEHQFIKPDYRGLFVVESTPRKLLDKLTVHEMPRVKKWIDREHS